MDESRTWWENNLTYFILPITKFVPSNLITSKKGCSVSVNNLDMNWMCVPFPPFQVYTEQQFGCFEERTKNQEKSYEGGTVGVLEKYLSIFCLILSARRYDNTQLLDWGYM